MMLTKKIAESYLIKVKDDMFPDALRDAIKKDWIPWGEPTFVPVPTRSSIGGMVVDPGIVVMVYLMMVKLEPTKLAVRHQRHVEDQQ